MCTRVPAVTLWISCWKSEKTLTWFTFAVFPRKVYTPLQSSIRVFSLNNLSSKIFVALNLDPRRQNRQPITVPRLTQFFHQTKMLVVFFHMRLLSKFRQNQVPSNSKREGSGTHSYSNSQIAPGHSIVSNCLISCVSVPTLVRVALPKAAERPRLKLEPTSAIDYDTECESPIFSSSSATARGSLLTFIGHTTTIAQDVPVAADAGDPHNSSQTRQKLLSRRASVSSNQRPSTSSATVTSTLSRSPSSVSLATASSSEGPETPRAISPLPSERDGELNRTFSDLEQYSRFRVQARCAVCKQLGSNYPSCARCGDMWCSRRCRILSESGSGKHLCQRRPGVSVVDVQQP